jgi:hypothetical protein
VGAGAVYLRPARQETAWDEWFKLPVIFLFSLPIGLDLAGSGQDWSHYFSADGAAPWIASFQPLPSVAVQTGFQLSFYALVFWLSGPAFWISLPLLPLLLWAGSLAAEKMLPNLVADPAIVATCTAALSFLVVAALVWLGRHWFGVRLQSAPRWHAVSRWARIRSVAPWLAALVIGLQQSSLLEGWLAGRELRFNAAGAALLLGVMLWLRWRERGGAVHVHTRILLALSLFVLLAAEWTDLEPLRNLSLGILLVGLCSWRRAWPPGVIAVALCTWTMTIPAGAAVWIYVGVDETTAVAARSILFFVGLLGVVVMSQRLPAAAPRYAFNDSGWQPVKRFGFILVCLLLGFQLASAFWRERRDGHDLPIHLTPEAAAVTRLRAGSMLADSSRARGFRIRWEKQDLQLWVFLPTDFPVRLNSPELMFESTVRRVVRRQFVVQPSGQARQLQFTRSGQTGCALYWFENGDRAFADYLRARRILWSGWNLTRRDLRLILLEAPKLSDPGQLVRFARTQNWFRDPTATAGLPQRAFDAPGNTNGGRKVRLLPSPAGPRPK